MRGTHQTAIAGGATSSCSAASAPATKRWRLVSSNGLCPTARSGHSAVVAKESLYIFGGCGHPAVITPQLAAAGDSQEAMPVCLGDLHVYDLARQRWSEVVCPKGELAGPSPAERTCAAMCTSEEEDRLFLSGGAGDDPDDLRADLLEFDVRRRSWRLLYDGGGGIVAASASSEVSACRRIGHAMVHDAARNRLVVFGGSTGFEYFDDTHAFDLAAGTWAVLATTGDRPSPRYKHQAFVDKDVMYVIGGGSFEPEGPDLDVYRLHLSGLKALEWERVRPTGTPPRCRAAHGLAWDRVGRAAYIWGGFTSGMELDSTFCALRLPPLVPPALDALPSPARSQQVYAVPAPAAAPAPYSTVAVTPTPEAAASSSAPAETAAAAAAVMRNESTRAGFAAAESGGNYARQAASAAARVKPRGSDDAMPSSQAGGLEGGEAASSRRAELAEVIEGEEEEEEEGEEVEERQQQESESGTPVSQDGGMGARGGYGRERWRRRGQRLWRQSGDGSDEGARSSISRRSRGSIGRRRPWGQVWATGRLQGLWGGGGAAHTPPSPSPSVPPPPPAPSASSTETRADGGAGAASAPHGTRALAPPHRPRGQLQQQQQQPPVAPAKNLVGEELAWVSLPSRASLGDAAGLAPSPAGRSFHCAFFHAGACYVTGGSDGARKFGDMWRFAARETPPPLTTLAARALAAAHALREKEGRSSGGRGGGGGSPLEMVGLPAELGAALVNLNMQAEVVL